MRLHDVANVFNNLSMFDGYTNRLLGKGQLDPWAGNLRDGVMGERRTLSLSPAELIPARRVVACVGTRFILGHGSSDDYRGTVIRTGYIAHEATFLSQVRTIEQVCLGQAGFNAWAGQVEVRDVGDAAESSKLVPATALHFAVGEPIAPNLLATFNGRLNVVRAVDFGAAGTLIASCEQLALPAVESAQLVTGVYDQVQDQLSGSPVTVTVVRMRWQSLFSYSSAAAPKFEPGDIQVAIAKSAATPVAGAALTLSDGPWLIQSVLAEGSVWLCRATRNG